MNKYATIFMVAFYFSKNKSTIICIVVLLVRCNSKRSFTMDESYYNKFIRLHETSDSVEANEYLECEWVLLNVVKTQVSEESWNTYYVLGWNKKVEDIKRGRSWKERMDTDIENYKEGRKKAVPDDLDALF